MSGIVRTRDHRSDFPKGYQTVYGAVCTHCDVVLIYTFHKAEVGPIVKQHERAHGWRRG